MARIHQTIRVDAEGLEQLRRPRTDLLIETADGADSWTVAEGPFTQYQRTLEVTAENGGFVVAERINYKLAIPLWWVYLALFFRSALKSTDREPRQRFWWPKEVVTAETSTLISFLGTIALVAGYLGVVIGQTISFASEDFGIDDDGQTITLAAIRIGVILSTALLWMADRRGRRPLIIWFSVAAIAFTVIGAFSPGMLMLGTTQAIARGLTTGLLTLLLLAAAEEVPASSRAMGISFLTLMAGLGAAGIIVMLPVAGIASWTWRIAYFAPLLLLPLIWWVSRHLPETRRYQAADEQESSAEVNWWWFTLVAATSFLSFVFLSPASQLRVEFLRDDLEYSANTIAFFQFMVSIPGMVAVPLGAWVADRFGRKWFGASALALSAVFMAISFLTTGWQMWVAAGLGIPLALSTIPALRGYGIELFPTKARGKVGGWLDVTGVAGSATGLILVGQLSVRWDNLGQAIAVTVPFALLTAFLIAAFYPETAQRELEEFNPGDPTMAYPDRAAEQKATDTQDFTPTGG